MTPYVHDAALPYGAYLQSDAAEAAPRIELTPWAGLLLGSPALPPGWPVPDALGAGAFHWGRCESLIQSDAFNAALPELKNTAKNSAAMWAMEQFDTARDALRRGLHREAFEYLHRAIHGDDEHEGYELDFRHHFLLGLIHLGSFQHHDADLLDLDRAKEAFVTAGRYALCDHPTEAALAGFAAGWCGYCQGHLDDALGHTQQAIALNPKLAEAQFQAAKILLHRREPEAARPYLAAAVGLNPAYGVQALHDGDFVPFKPLVLDVIEEERDTVGRRASQALKDLATLAAEMGIEAAGTEAPASATAATDSPFTSVVVLIEAARAAFRENTLYGYLRADVAAAVATRAANALRIRTRNERNSAEEIIQALRRELTEIAALQIGPYRLSATSLQDLGKVRAILEEAETAFRTQTLVGYLDAQIRAKRAQTALKQTVDSYRTSALEQAVAECEAIGREIEQLQRRRSGGGGGSVKTFALIGAIVALFPGGFLSIFSLPRGSDLNWSDLILRVTLSVAAFAMIGAALGALFAPALHHDRTPVDRQLEDRRAAIQQTIAELHALIRSV